MWLLGLLSDWSTDGLSGFGWGYKLSDHSLMTWHVELRALTQWTYERRDKSLELKVIVDVPLWVENIIWFKKKYLTFTVNIYSENIILFKKKYLPLPEIIYSENIILSSLLFVIGDNKRNGAILACLSDQSRSNDIRGCHCFNPNSDRWLVCWLAVDSHDGSAEKGIPVCLSIQTQQYQRLSLLQPRAGTSRQWSVSCCFICSNHTDQSLMRIFFLFKK